MSDRDATRIGLMLVGSLAGIIALATLGTLVSCGSFEPVCVGDYCVTRSTPTPTATPCCDHTPTPTLGMAGPFE